MAMAMSMSGPHSLPARLVMMVLASLTYKRPFMSIFLLFFLLFSFFNKSCAQGDLASDALALLDFKSNLTVGGSRALASWNISSPSTVCSSWAGVTCTATSNNSQQRVSSLRLPGKSLYGPIAAGTLGKLDALETLSLRSNRLLGSLPQDFSNLSSLRKLYLERNGFSGPLPSNFSYWPLLSQLDLSFNGFNGSIPASIGNLTHLKSLYLQNNSLDGAIPPLNIASLVNFDVANNELSGSVPTSLSRFPASGFAGNHDLCGSPLAACSSKTPQVSQKSKKLSTRAIVGIVCGAVALLILLLLLCVFFVCKKKGTRSANKNSVSDTREGAPAASDEPKRDSSAASTLGTKEAEERTKLVFIDDKKLFDLEDLLRASAEVLGKGSLGTAYKAVLEDGLIVAVKRLRDVEENRRGEYRHRIEMIGSLQHENLVPLRAYYFDKEENLLVYDYMQNGSLSALLHGSRGGGYNPLDWDTRVRIALTAARGLAYLHSRQFVHGNVKSSNVLLKSSLEACVADYGLAQMVSFTPGAHKSVGYLAPEVTEPSRVTEKGDVFSFGVLLLELLTGKAPLVNSSNTNNNTGSSSSAAAAPGGAGDLEDAVDLPRWVQSVVREEWTAEVFDPLLLQSSHGFNEEEMVQLLQVAMPCVAPSPDQRPSMAEVVRMIESLRKTTDDDKSSDSYTEQYPGSTSENP